MASLYGPQENHSQQFGIGKEVYLCPAKLLPDPSHNSITFYSTIVLSL